MADGLAPTPPGTTTSEEPSPSIGEFLHTRDGVIVVFAILAGICLASTLALNFSPIWGLNLIEAPFLTTTNAWIWFAAATCLLWLPLLLLLLDPEDNMATGPSLPLPLATLAVLTALAVASITFRTELEASFNIERGGTQIGAILSSAPLTAFFVLLGVAIIPRIWNAALFGQYAQAQYRARSEEALKASAAGDIGVEETIKNVAERRKEQGNAEALSALLATTAVALIGWLALVAGGWTSETRIGQDVGLVIAAVIFGIFAAVILLDWLAELPFVRSLSRMINGASYWFAFLATFYNFVDSLLVRIGAQVAGAGHNDPVARYGVLTGTQLCLAIMTWFLPDPLGLITAFLGFALALSVSRLWAWVEEDRNLALITQFKIGAPRRIGFKEDYRDEAIFGFLFVLAIIPMALKQADAGGLFNLDYFEAADPNDAKPWFVYFFFELAKALPIVDWADIYLKPGNFETLKPTDPWGEHATFLARALVDLVLVAALLQAISVALRNRQQKTLYTAKQINRLDELVEREELRKAVARPKAEWFTRGLNFLRYSPERLKELHSNTTDPRRKEFIEAIFARHGQSAGYALEALESLAKRRAPVSELEKTLRALKLERGTGTNTLEPMDLEGVFDDLRSIQGLKTFKFSLLDFAEEIGFIENKGSVADLAELLELVIFSARRDQFQYTRLHAAKILIRIVPHLTDSDRVSGLLANFAAARTEIFGASAFVPDQLEQALVTRLQEIGPPRNGN